MEHYLSRLQNATRNFWNKRALSTYMGESFTYEEMAVAIEKFHILFRLIGIQKGDKIAICARNSARWGIAYLTSSTFEGVCVPILSDFTPESIMHLVNHSESKVLFVNKDIWNKLDISKMPDLLIVISNEDWELLYSASDGVKAGYNEYEQEFHNKYPNGYKPEDVIFPIDNLENLSTINYTSGSTGSPKGVMLSYKNISYVVDFCRRHIFSDENDSIVSMLPMAHMYGLVIEFLYPICNGTDVYWLGKTPTPSLLLKAFADVKPYLLITVPLVMEKIFKSKVKPVIDKPFVKLLLHIPFVKCLLLNKIRKGLEGAFGGKVREFVFGGAALNPEVERWLRKIKLPYVVGYGMTEAAPLISYINHKEFAMGSCGRAIDWTDVRIDSPDPQNIVGEIQAKGSNVCMGYYKNPEATANLFTKDGYLKTGDLGIIDAKGNIFIRGRSKNMILGPSGQNIYPEEIEAVINNQNFVLETVVVERGGKLVALVFPDEKAADNNEELKQVKDIPEYIKNASNEYLPSYSKISKVELVEKPFEKTPKMSIKRFLYR